MRCLSTFEFLINIQKVKEKMEKAPPDECEKILNRVLEAERVEGYVVLNKTGLKETKQIENSIALQYASNFWDVTEMAQSFVRDLDPSNELLYYRIETKTNEFLVVLYDDEIIVTNQLLKSKGKKG